MPKTILSKELFHEIREYLETHPNETMESARHHFKMGVKLFRRVVRDELKMWNPRSKNPKRWPTNLDSLLEKSFETQPATIQEAYRIFLANYQGKEEIQFGTFRYFAKKRDLLKHVIRQPSAFAQTDFVKTFQKYPDPTRGPGQKTLRRAFFRFLLEVEQDPELVRLDPLLPTDLIFCYQKLRGKMCWTCGKRKHFDAPLVLEMDHISGQSFDHRLSNLRLLCPACHRLAITTNRSTNPSLKKLDLYDHFHPQLNIQAMKKERDQAIFDFFGKL